MRPSQGSHSNKALESLAKLESRATATKSHQLDLSLPPRPVPRRKRAFIQPGAPPPGPPPAVVADVVLDGFVLLEACRVEDPDEAEKAVLEGCGISSVISEDLSFFRKLTHLDLGDNQVQLASLAYLPALIELHLDCNGLSEVAVPPGGFPALEVLNLSYNGLTTAAVASLAEIPRLRQLDLSMNELSALPADLSGFGALQSLNCEHNLLGSEATWLALGTAPVLRSLSLAHNKVDSLAPSASETSFSLLATLDLANNLIRREEALLPVLQMGALRALLIYGNPFLKHGAASDDFHEVLSGQRGVDLITLPPAPPKAPEKIDLSGMTTVSEPPGRHAVLAHAKAKHKAKEERLNKGLKDIKEPKPEVAEEESSFFLTGGGAQGGRDEREPRHDPELEDATANALQMDFWAEQDALFDQNVDIRTAVTALKAALERPPVRPVNAGAHHLKMTSNLMVRKREKVVLPKLRTRPLLTGQEAPHRAGGAVEDMATGLSELQERMAAHAAVAGGAVQRGSADPMGDACVSHLGSMLNAMGEMQVGAGGSSAAPGRPAVA